MATITETSTLLEVFAANPPSPTVIDYETWVSLPD